MVIHFFHLTEQENKEKKEKVFEKEIKNFIILKCPIVYLVQQWLFVIP
jgi:hypothetical protein